MREMAAIYKGLENDSHNHTIPLTVARKNQPK